MIIKYEKFLKEGIFDFFKKDDKFQFVPISGSLGIFVSKYKLENEDPNVIQRLENYINEFNQIGMQPRTRDEGKRKIKLFLNIKELSKQINLRAYLAFAREKLIEKEIKFKNKKILVDNCCGNINHITFYDNNGRNMIVPLENFRLIKVKEEINRIISKVDPYGEETWGD